MRILSSPTPHRSLSRASALIALIILVLSSCSPPPPTTRTSETVVLDYDDFGPSCLAYETIGMDWWQWDKCGDSDPRTRYDIKVVVYRGIPLEKVRLMYPVLKEKSWDFRYIEYSKAIEYLEKGIQTTQDEESTRSIAETFRAKRKRLIEALGRPKNR